MHAGFEAFKAEDSAQGIPALTEEENTDFLHRKGQFLRLLREMDACDIGMIKRKNNGWLEISFHQSAESTQLIGYLRRKNTANIFVKYQVPGVYMKPKVWFNNDENKADKDDKNKKGKGKKNAKGGGKKSAKGGKKH